MILSIKPSPGSSVNTCITNCIGAHHGISQNSLILLLVLCVITVTVGFVIRRNR